MNPQLPIDVDAQTGIWTTDGLPMIYVPRHFFVNNHVETEAVVGREVYAPARELMATGTPQGELKGAPVRAASILVLHQARNGRARARQKPKQPVLAGGPPLEIRLTA